MHDALHASGRRAVGTGEICKIAGKEVMQCMARVQCVSGHIAAYRPGMHDGELVSALMASF